MPKANICLIGLSNQFIDKYALELSKKLDMFYANAEKIIQFELFDMNRMEEICGKEYLEKKESSVLKHICTYENTLINVDYKLLNNDTNYKNIKESCLIIYLRINLDRYIKEIEKDNYSDSAKNLNIDLFKDRDFICCKKADMVVQCENLQGEHLVDTILQTLLDYYEN